MGQMFNIYQGWKKYLKGSVTELERSRAKLCKECPEAVVGTYEKLMPDYELKEVKGLKCNQCGCPLSTKLRSKEESCPLGKW